MAKGVFVMGDIRGSYAISKRNGQISAEGGARHGHFVILCSNFGTPRVDDTQDRYWLDRHHDEPETLVHRQRFNSGPFASS